MAQKSATGKMTCIRMLLWVLLIVLMLVLVTFFTITSLFDLGVWSEFWDEVRQWFGG